MRTSREYPFTWEEFEALRRLVVAHTGNVVTDTKFEMFYSRLARRLRALGLRDFRDYLALLRQCLQQRQFPQAGGAPGREVVDQERLASKLRQCDRLALAVAELGGRGAGCQQSRHNQPTNSFHFLCPAAYPVHPFPLQ